eukprot:1378687-Pyramimonas_sp.AAC.1
MLPKHGGEHAGDGRRAALRARLPQSRLKLWSKLVPCCARPARDVQRPAECKLECERDHRLLVL